ncbi:MAG TPA: hypothetical protein VG754_02805 [Verrucomicrobiae bacterium]|nr:hypothetical protein [Verrucomicrobiae bacterium]
MKTKLVFGWLILVSAVALLVGCQTSNQQVQNIDLEFPPGPPLSANSP